MASLAGQITARRLARMQNRAGDGSSIEDLRAAAQVVLDGARENPTMLRQLAAMLGEMQLSANRMAEAAEAAAGAASTPHVVLSTRYGGGPDVDANKDFSKSVTATEMFEAFGCTVYNPNTMCPQDMPELQWLERYQQNLHRAAASKGFLVQLHQNESREKTSISSR